MFIDEVAVDDLDEIQGKTKAEVRAESRGHKGRRSKRRKAAVKRVRSRRKK